MKEPLRGHPDHRSIRVYEGIKDDLHYGLFYAAIGGLWCFGLGLGFGWLLWA